MRFYTSYTPRHWEIGLGFYRGQWHINFFSMLYTYQPSEFAILLGPFSLCFVWGHETTVIR